MADVEITVGLDTSDLNKDAKKTDKSLKDLQKQQDQLEDGFKSGKEAADIFGGSLGAAAGALEKAKNSAAAASAALGPVGVAAAVAAVALVGIGVAAVKAVEGYVALVGAAGEAVDRLSELEGVGITEEDIATIDRARDSLGALGIVSDEIVVAFGVDLANAFEETQRVVLKLSFITRDFIKSLSENADTIRLIATVVAPQLVGTYDLLELHVKALDIATKDYDAEVEEYIGLAKEQRTADERKAASTAAAAKATKEAAEEEKRRKKLMKELLDSIKEISNAQDDLAGITAAANEDLLTDQDKINLAFQERIDQINELERVSGDADAAAESRAASEQRRIRDTFDLVEDLDRETKERKEKDAQDEKERLENLLTGISDAIGVFGDLTDALGKVNQFQIDSIEDQINAQQDATEARFQGAEDEIEAQRQSGAISDEEADKQLSNLAIEQKAQEEADKKNAKAQKKRALELFEQQQALATAGVFFNTAQAIMAAFATLGPILGIPAAAAIGITSGIQIATINRQEPPQFPHGTGRIGDAVGGDHSLVGVQDEEAVLTPRGVNGAGGSQGVEALNRGATMPTSTTIEIDGIAFARAVTRNPGAAKVMAKALRPHLQGAF